MKDEAPDENSRTTQREIVSAPRLARSPLPAAALLLYWGMLLCLFTPIFEGNCAQFSNGSFELPPVLPASQSNYYVFLPAGDTRLSGWTIGGTNTAPGVLGSGITRVNGIIQDLAFPPAEGHYQLVFNDANRPSGDWISQQFDTVPGATYVVGFYVGRRSGGTGHLSMLAMALSDSGQTLGTLIATPPAQGYGTQQAFTFTARTASAILKIQDTSAATVSVDITLDDVTVTQVEPASLHIAIKAGIASKTVEVLMSVTVGVMYQLDSSKDLVNWIETGSPFQAQQRELSQEFDTLESGRYFRLRSVP